MQKSRKYIDILDYYFLPFIIQELGPSWGFRKDGASIYRVRQTLQWFEEEEILFLEWPSNSPELNPIEYLLSIFARTFYAQ